jgi:hypothetical protein
MMDLDIQRLEDDGGPPLAFDRARYEAEDIVSRLETRARIRRELKRGTKTGDRIADLLEEAARLIKSQRIALRESEELLNDALGKPTAVKTSVRESA